MKARIQRISKVEQEQIRTCAKAVNIGEAINHTQVANRVGAHPVDAAIILGRYAELYGQMTVDFYSRG